MKSKWILRQQKTDKMSEPEDGRDRSLLKEQRALRGTRGLGDKIIEQEQSARPLEGSGD